MGEVDSGYGPIRTNWSHGLADIGVFVPYRTAPGGFRGKWTFGSQKVVSPFISNLWIRSSPGLVITSITRYHRYRMHLLGGRDTSRRDLAAPPLTGPIQRARTLSGGNR